MRGARSALLAVGLAAGLLVPGVAAADPEPETALPSGPAFRYDKPADREYVRAVLEELAILAIGETQYLLDQQSNSVDWDLAYDWPSFRSKLTFQSVAFDTNRFPTNWVTHPAAGYLYYSAARSNRLSITESFLFAVASSTMWEYLGEYREQVSVNDQIVTPVSGAIFGESTMQLGALFRRSRRTPLTTTLAWLFAPPKHIHDAIDGVTTPTADQLDAWGFPDDEWHRFTLAGAAAVTKQDRSRAESDGRFALASRVVALHAYEKSGNDTHLFDSGQVSSLGFDVATNGSALVDLRVTSSMMPAGVYYRDLRRDADGRLQGYGLLAGMVAGFEYGVHEYDRDGRRPIDEIALVDAGAMAEHAWHVGPVVMRSSLDTLVNFAGVKSYALTRYIQESRDVTLLPSVLEEQGYYHALGATLHPAVTIELGRVDLAADARFDWFGALTGLDRDRPPSSETPLIRDRRVALRGAIGASPASWLHLSVAAERRQRNGRIGGVTDSRGETSFAGNVELRF